MNRQAAVLLSAVLAAAALAREPDFREFRFTRSGSDSIQYYYSDSAIGGTDGYRQMLVGGTDGA